MRIAMRSSPAESVLDDGTATDTSVTSDAAFGRTTGAVSVGRLAATAVAGAGFLAAIGDCAAEPIGAGPID